jgi:NADPH-dependent curcumin reductase CurA
MGLLDIGRPKPGETVVVAAATGAVGSVVGQIAKLEGARAVGIAGGAEKCRHAVDVLGFDACVDHRSPGFAKDLAAACPAGIDVYFENVGGKVFQTVLPLLNTNARVPVCGLIAQYSLDRLPDGPDLTPLLMRSVLTKRVLMKGFIIFDYAARIGEFTSAMTGWVETGKIKYREDVVDGLENAPSAFLGLLEGKNFGKLVVRVAAD